MKNKTKYISKKNIGT